MEAGLDSTSQQLPQKKGANCQLTEFRKRPTDFFAIKVPPPLTTSFPNYLEKIKVGWLLYLSQLAGHLSSFAK